MEVDIAPGHTQYHSNIIGTYFVRNVWDEESVAFCHISHIKAFHSTVLTTSPMVLFIPVTLNFVTDLVRAAMQ